MSSEHAIIPLAEDEALIQSIVNLCGLHLQKSWSYQRTPKGLEEAWRATRESGGPLVDKIFLEKGGLAVWCSLYLARRERELRGPSGRIMQGFLNLSADQQSIAARKLAAIQVHPTVQGAVENLQRGRKRRRVNEAADEWPLSAIDEHQRRNRCQVDEPTEVTSAPESDDENEHEDEHEGCGFHLSTEPADFGPSTLNTIEILGGKFSDASTKAASELFPAYMNGAIRRNKVLVDNAYVSRAAITMTFPAIPSEKDDGAMSFEISENKVQYCAQVLFGVNIEIEGNRRYLVYPNGSRMLFSNLDMQDCQRDTIAAMFGDETDRGIRNSKFFREEEKEARGGLTGCVRMAVSQHASEGAFITLNLGLAEACHVRDKLYM